jgi:hypothetical protein
LYSLGRKTGVEGRQVDYSEADDPATCIRHIHYFRLGLLIDELDLITDQ